MATINIYNTTVRGSLVMTGNTILVAPEGGNNYINPVPAPPSGSLVSSYLQNGSSATITIPNTATMFNTKLVWAGVTGTSSGIVLSPILKNSPVTLTMPSGSTFSISPNLAWQQTLGITGNATAYVNIADITSLVSSIPNGYYTVRGLPTLPIFFGGWLLYITYKDTNEPFRNINIWSILSQINAGQTPVDIPVSGFMTPSGGNVTGKVIFAAGNGQPQLLGENVLLGPSTTTLSTLSGPNNPINNFFQGQVNDNDGFLNKLGTFGNKNTPLGQSAATGDRILWDITRVDASPGLTINQSSAIIRTTTSFDSYWISSVGLQVDINAANLSPVIKTVDKSFSDVGETLKYTIAFGNSGLVESFNTILTDTLPSGLSFVPGTVTINDVPSPSFNPQTGIMVGTVDAGVRFTITFNAVVTTIPTPNPLNNKGDVGFDYSNSSGTGTIHDNTQSNIVSTYVNHVDLGSSKQVSKALATVGDILTYTIPINNVGNTTAVNIIFIDTLPNGTTFLSGTLTENGIPITGNPNPPGITLRNISANKTTTLVFKVSISSVPTPNPILNSATTIFTYTINPISIPNTTNSNSTNTNIASTLIKYIDLSNSIKYASKSFADCGDILVYTIVIPNGGNTTALNIIFTDTIPNGTTFISNSVAINNFTVPNSFPNLGITLANLFPNMVSTITFQVKVNC